MWVEGPAQAQMRGSRVQTLEGEGEEMVTGREQEESLPPQVPQLSKTLRLLGRVREGGKGIAVVKWRDGRGPVGHAVAAGAGGVAAPAHAARVKGSTGVAVNEDAHVQTHADTHTHAQTHTKTHADTDTRTQAKTHAHT